MEINGSTPKEVEYIRKLQEHSSRGWRQKIKSKLTRSDKRYSFSDLAEVLSHKHDDYAYQFLEKLEEHDVLEEAGRRENASGTVEVYKLNRSKLYTTFSQTSFYQENRDLFTKTLEKAENKELI